MRFKTRRIITLMTVIVMPLLLTAMAFTLIGTYLLSVQRGYSLDDFKYSMMTEMFQTFDQTADEMFEDLEEQVAEDVTTIESIEFLDELNDEMSKHSAFIIVRKSKQIYYMGALEPADYKIYNKLPGYGEGNYKDGTGIYYDEFNKYIKQLDFTFADGTDGSIFLIMKVNALISKELFTNMFIAITLILMFTGLILTYWLNKSVFSPINQLNKGMQSIREGNFDYMLQTDAKGDIGDLYRNYEDMRLRLKESSMEKEENENRNRELITNISHDLKTPITAIKGYVEGIMDGVADTPEKMDKYIRTVYNKANDMDKLINELTIYSGIDSNKIPYNFHCINVADYFGDCVEEVGLDLESRNISLHYTNMVPNDTRVIADPEQMKKVINNIISNSVKYLDKPEGRIEIRILDDAESIRIELEDNGKGIAQKDLAKIFDRFYRTDASRNSAQGGSGIGLSIVKKIVEDHGGYIWATSREGEGTCIHFVLRKYIELQNEV